MSLRGIISVLALLPMLMPPGMCVCQLLPEREVTAAAASTATPAPAKRCNCALHRARTTDATAKSAGTTLVARIGGTNSPSPESDDHCPGCPAAKSAAVTRTALVSASVQPAADLTEGTLPVELVQVTPRWLGDDHVVRPAPLPLFLSQRSLLI